MQGKDLLTVVGIVGDVRHGTLESPMTGEVYFPMRQRTVSRVDLVVRSSLPMAQLATSARGALESVAPQAAKGQWTTMQELIDTAASPRRFVVLILSGFATFAVLLAAIGIYALISFGVTQRRQEFGIRLALGAAAADVRNAVLRATLRLAGIGALLGVVVAMVVVPAMRAMLVGVSWTDPASFAAAVFILLVVAGGAGWIPAHRASRVDPSVALRD